MNFFRSLKHTGHKLKSVKFKCSDRQYSKCDKKMTELAAILLPASFESYTTETTLNHLMREVRFLEPSKLDYINFYAFLRAHDKLHHILKAEIVLRSDKIFCHKLLLNICVKYRIGNEYLNRGFKRGFKVKYSNYNHHKCPSDLDKFAITAIVLRII